VHKKRRGLEGFRQRGSFIVGCEKKMAREMGRGKKDGWWRKTPQKSLI